MLVLNPQHVSINNARLDHVSAIAINRAADRLAIERDDLGPFPVFADVPAQRVTIVITRDLLSNDANLEDDLMPGAEVDLTFTLAPNQSAAGARALACTVVITSVASTLQRNGGARQTIEGLALSTDGVADPITPAPKGGPR